MTEFTEEVSETSAEVGKELFPTKKKSVATCLNSPVFAKPRLYR